jgi:hypothetical protein
VRFISQKKKRTRPQQIKILGIPYFFRSSQPPQPLDLPLPLQSNQIPVQSHSLHTKPQSSSPTVTHIAPSQPPALQMLFHAAQSAPTQLIHNPGAPVSNPSRPMQTGPGPAHSAPGAQSGNIFPFQQQQHHHHQQQSPIPPSTQHHTAAGSGAPPSHNIPINKPLTTEAFFKLFQNVPQEVMPPTPTVSPGKPAPHSAFPLMHNAAANPNIPPNMNMNMNMNPGMNPMNQRFNGPPPQQQFSGQMQMQMPQHVHGPPPHMHGSHPPPMHGFVPPPFQMHPQSSSGPGMGFGGHGYSNQPPKQNISLQDLMKMSTQAGPLPPLPPMPQQSMHMPMQGDGGLERWFGPNPHMTPMPMNMQPMPMNMQRDDFER